MSAILYFWVAPKLLGPGLDEFLGAERKERIARAKRLTLLPYLVGAATIMLAGAFNPYGGRMFALSAAAVSLGGMSLLAWWGMVRARTARGTGPAMELPRSVPWLVAAPITLVLFVVVLGRGVQL